MFQSCLIKSFYANVTFSFPIDYYESFKSSFAEYWLTCQPVPDTSNPSLQLDLHVEGSAPITLLVRDESRSTKSYQPQDSPTSPLSPFLTRKVRSASPHVENEKDTLPTPCGGTCCPRGTIKQVSWGSTSSLTPSPQPAPATPAVSPWVSSLLSISREHLSRFYITSELNQ